MMEAARAFPDYQFVVAGAPGIDKVFYQPYLKNSDVLLAKNCTYRLLYSAKAALVTSGTATLETCLFRVPQVVCYKTPLPKLVGFLRRRLLKVPYISLVNLVADREVVTELVADTFSIRNIQLELSKILNGPDRQTMLNGYQEVRKRLGNQNASDNTARIICELLRK